MRPSHLIRFSCHLFIHCIELPGITAFEPFSSGFYDCILIADRLLPQDSDNDHDFVQYEARRIQELRSKGARQLTPEERLEKVGACS